MCFSATNFCHDTAHLESTVSSGHNWMSFIFYRSSLLKLNVCSLSYLNNLPNSTVLRYLPACVTLSPVPSAHNLGAIFYSNLSFSEHISAICKSCLYRIHESPQKVDEVWKISFIYVKYFRRYKDLENGKKISLVISLLYLNLVHELSRLSAKCRNVSQSLGY